MKYASLIIIGLGLILSLSSCSKVSEPALAELLPGTWQRVAPVGSSSYSYHEFYEFKAYNSYTFTRAAINNSDGELLGYHIIVNGSYYLQEGKLTFFPEEEYKNTNTIIYYSALEDLEHRTTNRENGPYTISLEDDNKTLHLNWNGPTIGLGKALTIYHRQK